MWIGFLDQDGRVEHNLFQDWRRSHPAGFILRFTAIRVAYIHLADCRHFGDARIRYRRGQDSLTSQLKVCHVSKRHLENWAKNYDIEVTQCSHCLGREF